MTIETRIKAQKRKWEYKKRAIRQILEPETGKTHFQIPRINGVMKTVIERGDNVHIRAETNGSMIIKKFTCPFYLS